jgi:nucleoside-diphosphate-sugar epimerase
MISQLVDYKGEIRTNNKSLNGANYKVLNSSQFNNLGWRPKFSLEKGLELLINN